MSNMFKRGILAAVVAGAAVLTGAGATVALAAPAGDVSVAETRQFDGRAIGASPGLAISGALNSAYSRAASAGFSRGQCFVVTQGSRPVGTSGYDGWATIQCTR